MMKPYGRHGFDIPQRIHNYITSHLRRVCKNAFGILANRFSCLLTTIKFQPDIASTIVLAAICQPNGNEISCYPECSDGLAGCNTQRMAKRE